MPFDIPYMEEEVKTVQPPTTWSEKLSVRLQVGRYNFYMKNGGGCMGSRRGNIRLTPFEELQLVNRIIANIYSSNAPKNWDFSDSYTITHRPSGIQFWVSNGKSFLRIYRPQGIPLRTHSQRRLWRALQSLRAHVHQQRHETFSAESQQLINKF